MLFNSIPFLLLFLITYLVYWNIEDSKKRWVLFFSSAIFYIYYDILAAVHFFTVIIINYYFSSLLISKKQKSENTSTLLRIIIILNILNLAFFKYFYFILDSLFGITSSQIFIDLSKSYTIILPLAISFYTFQLIAIQVDIHRELIKEKIPFLDYTIFIIFFPQLIAGPIMRTIDFLPKLRTPEITDDSMKKGLFLIIMGLFKKVVIADSIAVLLNPVFFKPLDYHYTVLLLCMLGFAVQVYSDFSGYTDIARGLANLLGFEIPENFRGPFYSITFTEFWSRWHITLSTWLRDYIYIPLGGNRGGFALSVFNMFLTMLIGGLWHGANLAFILWGAYFGLALGIERIFAAKNILFIPKNPILQFCKRMFIFCLFASSAVFFRAGAYGTESLTIMKQILQNLFTLNIGKSIGSRDQIILYIFLTIVLNIIQYDYKKVEPLKKYQNTLIPIFSLILFLLLGIFGDGGGDFIYFQF
jgi:D-alanyl-lipoteichoic acid acyltransferase DltB (MBOAT superfamily)